MSLLQEQIAGKDEMMAFSEEPNCERAIRSLQGQIAAKDERIARLKERDYDRVIRSLREKIRAKDELIAFLEERIVRMSLELASAKALGDEQAQELGQYRRAAMGAEGDRDAGGGGPSRDRRLGEERKWSVVEGRATGGSDLIVDCAPARLAGFLPPAATPRRPRSWSGPRVAPSSQPSSGEVGEDTILEDTVAWPREAITDVVKNEATKINVDGTAGPSRQRQARGIGRRLSEMRPRRATLTGGHRENASQGSAPRGIGRRMSELDLTASQGSAGGCGTSVPKRRATLMDGHAPRDIGRHLPEVRLAASKGSTGGGGAPGPSRRETLTGGNPVDTSQGSAPRGIGRRLSGLHLGSAGGNSAPCPSRRATLTHIGQFILGGLSELAREGRDGAPGPKANDAMSTNDQRSIHSSRVPGVVFPVSSDDAIAGLLGEDGAGGCSGRDSSGGSSGNYNEEWEDFLE